MKYLRLVFACVLCALPAVLHAQNGIQILSQSYSISASWNATWYDGNGQLYPLGDWSAGYSSYPMTGGYSLSSSDGSPVAASTASPNPFGGTVLSASASIDLFSVQNNATAGMYRDPLNPDAPYVTGWANTSVQADWFFSPAGNNLDVHLSDSWDYNSDGIPPQNPNVITSTLRDITDSITLLNINPISGTSIGDYSYVVNPSHIYEFVVTGYSEFGLSYNGFASQSASASITSVPEPAPGSLVGLGLAVIFLRRKKLEFIFRQSTH